MCGLDVAGIGDELAGRIFLGNDAGVILQVGRRVDNTAQLGDIERSAHVFEHALSVEFLGNGEDVHGLLLNVELADSSKDALMARLIEALGMKNFANQRIGILLNHQCAQHGFLEVNHLWLQVAILVGLGRRGCWLALVVSFG